MGAFGWHCQIPDPQLWWVMFCGRNYNNNNNNHLWKYKDVVQWIRTFVVQPGGRAWVQISRTHTKAQVWWPILNSSTLQGQRKKDGLDSVDTSVNLDSINLPQGNNKLEVDRAEHAPSSFLPVWAHEHTHTYAYISHVCHWYTHKNCDFLSVKSFAKYLNSQSTHIDYSIIIMIYFKLSL